MIPKYQELQNQYFAEYRAMVNTEASVRAEAERWQKVNISNPPENNILYFPLEKQAEYGDYVTRNMVTKHKDLLDDVAKDYLKQFSLIQSHTGSCAIGNTALLIISMSDSPLKESVMERHLELVEATKNSPPVTCNMF